MSAEHNPVGTAEVQAAAEGAKLLLAVREWIEQAEARAVSAERISRAACSLASSSRSICAGALRRL